MRRAARAGRARSALAPRTAVLYYTARAPTHRCSEGVAGCARSAVVGAAPAGPIAPRCRLCGRQGRGALCSPRLGATLRRLQGCVAGVRSRQCRSGHRIIGVQRHPAPSGVRCEPHTRGRNRGGRPVAPRGRCAAARAPSPDGRAPIARDKKFLNRAGVAGVCARDGGELEFQTRLSLPRW